MNRKEDKYRRVALAALMCLALGAGCGNIVKKNHEKIVVAVSVLPQSYFVKRIGGDLVDVMVMIPPGASPATYEPSMQQMIYLARASLYIKVGHPNFSFERTWLDRLLAQGDNIAVVNSCDGIPQLEGDPHIWTSPKSARIMAKKIGSALKSLMPSQNSTIEANLQNLLADVDVLDREIAAILSKQTTNRFYVFHPSWGYLARDYGLEQISIEHGCKEPSLEEVKTIVREARAEGVKVVFAQPQMSKKSARIVADEIGGRVIVIDPLSRDWLANMKTVATRIGEAISR